jgi:hypothetical protein
MVPGRAARTAAIAAPGACPTSTRRQAAIIPVRPRPPMQQKTTAPPRSIKLRNRGAITRHLTRNDASGMEPSTIGASTHSIPRVAVRRERSSSDTRTDRNSCGSSRETRICAPQSRMAHKSRIRSRFHPPVTDEGWLFPGQNVIPIRPLCSPIIMESTRNGLLMLDRSAITMPDNPGVGITFAVNIAPNENLTDSTAEPMDLGQQSIRER